MAKPPAAPSLALPSEKEVIQEVAALLDEWALTPPVSLEVVAGIQGVSAVERGPLPHAACLVPLPDGGALIRLRASDSIERQNFSGFHEIGHTLMPGYQLAIQWRCDPDPGSARDRLEHLCDVAASEFLLPREAMVADLAAGSLDFETVEQLAIRYRASLEATARRVAALWPDEALLLHLEVANKPRDAANAEPCLRSTHFVPESACCRAIPQHKSLSAGDPLQAVLKDGSFSGLTALHGLTDGARLFRVSARYAPWTEPATGRLRRRVLALARPALRAVARRG